MIPGAWEGLSEIYSTTPHVNVIATWPCSDPKALNAGGYTDSRTAEVESKRPDAYAFAKVKTHAGDISIQSGAGNLV